MWKVNNWHHREVKNMLNSRNDYSHLQVVIHFARNEQPHGNEDDQEKAHKLLFNQQIPSFQLSGLCVMMIIIISRKWDVNAKDREELVKSHSCMTISGPALPRSTMHGFIRSHLVELAYKTMFFSNGGLWGR